MAKKKKIQIAALADILQGITTFKTADISKAVMGTAGFFFLPKQSRVIYGRQEKKGKNADITRGINIKKQ